MLWKCDALPRERRGVHSWTVPAMLVWGGKRAREQSREEKDKLGSDTWSICTSVGSGGGGAVLHRTLLRECLCFRKMHPNIWG